MKFPINSHCIVVPAVRNRVLHKPTKAVDWKGCLLLLTFHSIASKFFTLKQTEMHMPKNLDSFDKFLSVSDRPVGNTNAFTGHETFPICLN